MFPPLDRRTARTWVALSIASFVVFGVANATSGASTDAGSEPPLDAGAGSDAGAASNADAAADADAGPGGRAIYAGRLSDPAFATRSSTTLGPAAVEVETPPKEPSPGSKEGSNSVATFDFEAGTDPFQEGDPVTLGLGFGFREVTHAATSMGPSARFILLTMALVHTRDEHTGEERTTVLGGGAPLFADLDLYWRVGATFRLGIGTRAGLYVAPRLFPLFAVGAGVAADVGNLRYELAFRLQPLPTGIALISGDEVWTRPRWFIIPTLHVSLPLGK